MPYYTRPKHVVHFSYRDFEIDVLKAFRGATHCDLDHRPRQKVCQACGEPIVPRLVHLVEIDGSRTDVECDSEEEACEFARMLIDDQLHDDEDDEDDADDADDDKPDTAKRGSDRQLLLPPPPPSNAPRPDLPSNILHQMHKLGWIKRAQAIIHQHPKD